MNRYYVTPGGKLTGSVKIPGDKSISHRSIIFGSIADGETRVEGFLQGEDCFATLNVFRQLGVEITELGQGELLIQGVGMHGLRAPNKPLYLGNSGTSMRLLSGLLSGQKFDCELTGDVSLSGRPMRRVTDPLATMGAKITTTESGTAPLKIEGKAELQGIDYAMPIASAQVKSCLLLAGLYSDGRTSVTEPGPSRDHTERMLRGFGYPVTTDGATISLEGGHRLTGQKLIVPADISSATFFMVGASIAEGSEIRLSRIGINPTRDGVIEILRLMGADLTLENEQVIGGEPVADILVRSAKLKGIHIPEALVPLAIDEFPAIFVAAACAEGETVLTGAEELRVKESDRIQVMADGLVTVGIDAKATPDGIIIQGGTIGGGEIESHGDHRIAMSFAMAGLRATAPICIQDTANVNTSFPGFVELAGSVGLTLEEQTEG